jgi:hypothetical protein
MGPVAQWITRLPTEQKIAGSIPARIEDTFLFLQGRGVGQYCLLRVNFYITSQLVLATFSTLISILQNNKNICKSLPMQKKIQPKNAPFALSVVVFTNLSIDIW